MTIKEAMDCFLKQYNTNRTAEKAASRAISAAVQRNKIYTTKDYSLRAEIRKQWATELKNIAERVKAESMDEQAYLNQVLDLKKILNSRFSDVDFRISHSQKSISVYLKHLWCLGDLNTPPQCPVDRIILTKIGVNYDDRKWGYVDSIEEHMRKYELIKEFAQSKGFDSTSEWELIAFC
jgi:hypothetical protein